MKFFLVFLGLFAVATAAPLAIRRAEHAALVPPVRVVGYRDIQNSDMIPRSDNSVIQVARANDDSIKRNFGENIQTRQVEEAIELVGAIVDLIQGLIDAINNDITLRDQFTVNSVTQGAQDHPNFNFVICHTDHTTAFDGTKDTDWGHSHHELNMEIGGTIGYELYWFRSGTFTRNGDGGYLNWAYDGAVTGTENGGSVVHFATRS